MLAARILFFLSFFALIGAINALRRAHTDRPPWRRPLWLPALVVAEAVPLRFAIHGAILVLCVWGGALDFRVGQVGLWLTIATWAGYAILQVRNTRAQPVMHAALRDAGIAGVAASVVDWSRVAVAVPFAVPGDLERIEDIEYAPGLTLDVYRRRDAPPGPRPALLQIHGGSWRGGNRRLQARPLVHHLSRQGWVCVSASYPLVPQATFPDQLVALKRALSWMRTVGTERFDMDPGFVAVTGGSAGGHLAALVALTGNQPGYQPGFETADTSVQAAVPLHGIYDLVNRNTTRDPWPIIPLGVMKATPDEAPDRYRQASPLDQVGEGAPPFFVVHGANDSVVPVGEAHQFVAALRDSSNAIVAYAEIPGANHSFDVLHSLRTDHVIEGIAAFLDAVRTGRVAATG
jgi:acetyl esterase/lipase